MECIYKVWNPSFITMCALLAALVTLAFQYLRYTLLIPDLESLQQLLYLLLPPNTSSLSGCLLFSCHHLTCHHLKGLFWSHGCTLTPLALPLQSAHHSSLFYFLWNNRHSLLISAWTRHKSTCFFPGTQVLKKYWVNE